MRTFILGILVLMSATAISQECGVISKPVEPDANYFDRFGNGYSSYDLRLPLNSGPEGYTGCDCDDLGISTGYFDLWFEDCDPQFGLSYGFNDPLLGVQRRQVLCQVFADLSALITQTNTSLQTVNIKIQPSGFVASYDEVGRPLAPLDNNILGTGSPIYSFYYTDFFRSIVHGLPWYRINEHGAFLSNGRNTNDAFFAGVLRFNFENSNFIWNNTTGLPSSNEIDLLTVAWHEALHMLGFVSALNSDINPIYGGVTRFDQFLEIVNDPFGVYPDYTSVLDENPNECGHIGLSQNVNLSDLENSCNDPVEFGPDLIFHSTNSDEIPIYSRPSADNSYSHLYINCDGSSTSDFVMHPNLPPGTRRTITQEEKNILCDLGYSIQSLQCDCHVKGFDDELFNNGDFLRVSICDQPFKIYYSDLLSNDVADEIICVENRTPTIISIIDDPINGEITITPLKPGLATLEYYPIGCNGQSGSLTYVFFTIYPDPSCSVSYCSSPYVCPVPSLPSCVDDSNCEPKFSPCNLVCNSDACGIYYGTLLRPSPWKFAVIDHPFNQPPHEHIAELPGWVVTHGSPDIFTPDPVGNPEMSIRIAGGDTNPLGEFIQEFSEGIGTPVDIDEIGDYFLSYHSAGQAATDLHISLIQGELLTFSHLNIGEPTLHDVYPNGAELELFTFNGEEGNLLQPLYIRHGACINVDNLDLNFLWFYRDPVGLSSSIHFDDVELLYDNFNAGSDLVLDECFTSANLGGEEFCLPSDLEVEYTWGYLGTGVTFATYVVKNGVVLSHSGTFNPINHEVTVDDICESTQVELTRTIVDYAGFDPDEFQFCRSSDVVNITLNNDCIIDVANSIISAPTEICSGEKFEIELLVCLTDDKGLGQQSIELTSTLPSGLKFLSGLQTQSDLKNLTEGNCFTIIYSVLSDHSLTTGTNLDIAFEIKGGEDCIYEDELLVPLEVVSCTTECSCPTGITIGHNANSYTYWTDLGLNSSLTSQTLCINGTLILDQNVSISSSDIIMGAGAQIVIESNHSFDSQFNIYTPCNGIMFKGIIVSSNSVLIFKSNEINFAEHGIELLNGAIALTIEGNEFNNNFVGVYTSSDMSNSVAASISGNTFMGGNLITPHQNQDFPATKSLAAVWLQNTTGVNIGSTASEPNLIESSRFGIILENSAANVLNNEISSLDDFIEAPKSSSSIGSLIDNSVAILRYNAFDDMDIAVQGIASDVRILNNSMSNIYQGCRIDEGRDKVLRIKRNHIVAKSHCVYVTNSSPMSEMEIVNNDYFEIVNSLFSFIPHSAIRIENSITATESNARIANNFNINLSDIADGIFIQNVGGIEINTNYINSYLSSANDGLVLINSSENIVYRNRLFTGLPNSGNGIKCENGEQNIFCCNYIEGFGRAIEYLGDCNDSKLSGNVMSNYSEFGLFLNTAILGDQVKKGNTWCHNSNCGIDDAFYFGSLVNLNLSEFFVASLSAPLWPSKITVSPTPGTWFIQAIPPDEVPCSVAGDIDCDGSPGVGGGDPEIGDGESLFANGDFDALEHSAGVNYQGQRSLFARLSSENDLLGENAIVDSFYYSNLEGPLNKLAQVDELINSTKPHDATRMSLIKLLDSILIDIAYLDSIRIKDNSNETNLISSISELDPYLLALMNYSDSMNVVLLSNWASANLVNLSILDTGLVALEAAVNSVIINSLGDEWELSVLDSLMMDSVSYLCPLSHGYPVYKARSFMTAINNFDYSELNICSGPNQANLSHESGISSIQNELFSNLSDIRIYPNPVKGVLNIYLPTSVEEMCIFDSNGKRETKIENCRAGKVMIDVSAFHSGILYVQVKIDAFETIVIPFVHIRE